MLKFCGKKAFALVVALLIVPRFAAAQGQPSAPDWKLAFVLATVSYCAYGLSSHETKQDDKALGCLREAANKAPPFLDELNVGPDSVEAYVDSEKGIDAYLLVKSTRGPILAFRGTLAPPEIKGLAISNVIQKAAEFDTFVSDWVNDANLIGSDDGRYPGINASWRKLLDHLRADCAKGETDSHGGCSKFQQFLGNSGGKSQLFLTGHSKGGALATLATVEFNSNKPGGGGVDVTTYTFEAPKVFALEALTPTIRSDVRERTRDLWRFEYKNDIVPLIPLGEDLTNSGPLNDLHQKLQRLLFLFPTTSQDDKSLGQRTFYEPVGNLAYVNSGNDMMIQNPPIPGSVPGDSQRISTYFQDIESSFSSFDPLVALPSLCSAVVNKHFMILVDVQRLAAAGSTKIDEDGWETSFFAQGLGDSGQFMWGFKKRCEFLRQ
jgi:hypothetical protein